MNPQTPHITDLPRMPVLKPITTKLAQFTPTEMERELWRHDEQCAILSGKPCDCLAAIPRVQPPIEEQIAIQRRIRELKFERTMTQQRLDLIDDLISLEERKILPF